MLLSACRCLTLLFITIQPADATCTLGCCLEGSEQWETHLWTRLYSNSSSVRRAARSSNLNARRTYEDDGCTCCVVGTHGSSSFSCSSRHLLVDMTQNRAQQTDVFKGWMSWRQPERQSTTWERHTATERHKGRRATHFDKHSTGKASTLA